MKKFLLLERVATQMTYAQDITATVTHETGVSANNGTIVLEGLGGFARLCRQQSREMSAQNIDFSSEIWPYTRFS